MCNLYSETSHAQAIIDLVKAFNRAGNLPAMPSIFPDKMAPVVRTSPADGLRELTMLRWGMPSPPTFLKPGAIDPGVTNIRNASSPHWRRWLGPANRCVVPATSFCEPTTLLDPTTGRKIWTWFALREDRPLFFFAGVWCSWTGVRGTKKEPVTGEHQLFGFLTTEPNGTVKPVHEKAMPVILRTPDEVETWMNAPTPVALELQRPLPDGALTIVLRGAKEDGGRQTPSG
jgi:putative SOS response-associated peptidase YedK